MSHAPNWNHKLGERLEKLEGHPATKYMLAAGVRNLAGDGPRADLVLYKYSHERSGRKIILNRPCLVLIDGTGPNNAKSWQELRDELRIWCDRYKGDGQDFLLRTPGTPCWAVATKGDEVTFWLYTGNHSHTGSKEKETILPVSSTAKFLRRVNEPEDPCSTADKYVYGAESRETSLILGFIDSFPDPDGMNGGSWKPYQKLFYYPTGGY